VRTKNEDLILIFRDGSFLLPPSFLVTPKKRAKGMGQMSLATEKRADMRLQTLPRKSSNPLFEFD